ncbi:MAG: DUF4190 domain-containing protein [Bacilli bacterium]
MNNKTKNKGKKVNGICVISFIIGLLSIFLGFTFIVPIIALVLGLIGITTLNKEKQKGMWMAIVGLILGILFLCSALWNNEKTCIKWKTYERVDCSKSSNPYCEFFRNKEREGTTECIEWEE